MKYLVTGVLLLILSNLFAAATTPAIEINQLGYYVYAPKIAVLTNDTTSVVFYIVGLKSNDTVYRGKLSEIRQSANSSTKTRIADFSSFRIKGEYRVVIPGIQPSYPFQIKNNANHAAAVAVLKGYYYQRVSMPLEEQYAGKWKRPAGHPDLEVLIHPSAATAERPAGSKIACPGGWYDAGDYNKYIVNSGITMGTLLSACEDFPSYFDTLHTNIPESKDALPDILNEILYNLRWMLTMQDPNDGGVYNKCTNAAFDGMVMPGVTTLPRYVVQKGTAATLDFAAVMAQASRIAATFKKQLPGLTDSCWIAATKAWQWAKKNPALVYDQDAMNKLYEPKITTGGYGDRDFKDEWFWAASELFATSKDKQYYGVLLERINETMVLPSWGNVGMLGYYTLIRYEKSLPAVCAAEIQHSKSRLIQFTDVYLAHIKESAFETVMGQSKKDFNWGSNSNAANQGIALINTYFITHDRKYIDAALTNLDYLLGRNATGYSFLTGIGTKSPMHPHHRQSVADGIEEPVPGLLAGGPNPGRQDKCHYDFFEPETCYADIDCSYASNEIAINWNAPLVYLANAIEALQFDLGYSGRK